MIKRLLILLYLCCSFTGVLQKISDADKERLTLMREEEKLSRDVYRTLNEKWNQTVFEHISGAEMTHMQELKSLMDRYHVEDPVAQTRDQRGKFVNEYYQELYDSLVASGVASLKQALQTGAFVEERGILDLQSVMEEAELKDLKATYGYLIQASEQHLRTFARNLGRVGVTYFPVLMPKEQYESIVGSAGGAGSWRRMN